MQLREGKMSVQRREIEILCIMCPVGCRGKIEIDEKSNILKISNLQCKRGEKYVINEYKSPVRVITATVRTKNSVHSLLSVKTNKTIPKNRIMECMCNLAKVRVHPPVRAGQVLVPNIIDTEADIVATRDLTE